MGLKTRGLGWLRFHANSCDLDTTVLAPPTVFRDPPLPTWAPDDRKQTNSIVMATLQREPRLKMERYLSNGPKPSDLTHFANNATLHGLPRVFPEGSKGWNERRTLWGVTVVTMVLLFLYWGAEHIGTYFRYPVTTKLAQAQATELFPAVTICNLNTFRLSQLTQDDLHAWGHLMGFLHKNKTLKEHALTYLDQREETILDLARFSEDGHADVSMFDLQNRTGHSLEDMVRKCSYRGQTCNSSMFTPKFACDSCLG
uniref:Uncharacterized protein n=1 Tax=Branchiostoma floridae TaxID=7739 RepID=C3YSU1_BRAFL|eukprot:XP_002600593.1 hypothetical protein BRAFLDRAFT_101628 [Branchiostoma floridae]